MSEQRKKRREGTPGDTARSGEGWEGTPPEEFALRESAEDRGRLREEARVLGGERFIANRNAGYGSMEEPTPEIVYGE